MSRLFSTLDHIVIVAATLEQGVDYCEQILGVRPQKGGEHVRTGTHNCLLNLGDHMYLEVIAINPAVSTCMYPRWFGLDQPVQRERAANSPFLATFVASTNDICQATKMLPNLGPVRNMQRNNLTWEITIRDDGGLVEGGSVPTVIQWPPAIHPTQAMPDLGCRLQLLEVYHPQPRELEAIWKRIGLASGALLQVKQAEHSQLPHLIAHILTSVGVRTIS